MKETIILKELVQNMHLFAQTVLHFFKFYLEFEIVLV